VKVLDRRDFLKLSGAGAGALAVARFARPALAAAGSAVFQHGVASGDPTSDSFLIWTRVTPDADAIAGSGIGRPAEVRWQVATDPGFKRVVRDGIARATTVRDHTIKVDVRGLDPDRQYHYRFKALGELSETGHARTFPESKAEVQSLRFGLASCANYEGGHFAAYGYLAERTDLDFVLHMGDYIYEYGPGAYGPGESIGRVHEPDHEIVSLADYRIRHAQYKTDPHLQACHAAHPFITAWDDHEVTNDTWREGAENHQEEEGNFLTRRDRAYRAYFEWMPIRPPAPRKDPTRIYRELSFGPLADLHMLDTRQYRDLQAPNQADASKDDPSRTITGDAQMEWLKSGLAKKDAQWRLVGNQLMITPWEASEGTPVNVDSWDGYRADREELLTHISDGDIDNVVFLTGDIHTSWANDIPLDSTTYPVTPSVAVEMVGPSVTSDNLDEITGSPPRTSSIPLEEGTKGDNPYVKYVELDSHGYCVVDADGDRLHVDWFYLDDKNDPKSGQAFATAYQSVAGSNAVSPAEGPLALDRR
jgi:alkaline phosphatase D